MLFESLDRLGSKADRLLLYSSKFDLSDGSPRGYSKESQLLMKARDFYKVKLQPIEVQRRIVKEGTWAESFTKLLAFNQTQYDRVLVLDSDATVLQSMDELFFLPPALIAMPRSYLDDQPKMSSALMLLQPSKVEYQRVTDAIALAGSNDCDMEIVNDLYKNNCLVLPHRPYCLLTCEFASVPDHSLYLGSKDELWEPEKVFKEAKYFHYSDWPTPKPWLVKDIRKFAKKELNCTYGSQETDQAAACRQQDLWFTFYEDFTRRREEICGTPSHPKPSLIQASRFDESVRI